MGAGILVLDAILSVFVLLLEGISDVEAGSASMLN